MFLHQNFVLGKGAYRQRLCSRSTLVYRSVWPNHWFFIDLLTVLLQLIDTIYFQKRENFVWYLTKELIHFKTSPVTVSCLINIIFYHIISKRLTLLTCSFTYCTKYFRKQLNGHSPSSCSNTVRSQSDITSVLAGVNINRRRKYNVSIKMPYLVCLKLNIEVETSF